MRSRWAVTAIGLIISAAMAATSPSDAKSALGPAARLVAPDTDSIALPPERAETCSPNRQFALVIETPDGWQSRLAVAKLYRVSPSRESLLWQSRLPQEYGPRFAHVGNKGQVLLLDEWINIESRNAIWLRTLQNTVTYDFQAVAGVLNLPARQIVERAAFGWWISAPPSLAESGGPAIVPAAGKLLQIDLDTGGLSIVQ
jgi:hypothetical protein